MSILPSRPFRSPRFLLLCPVDGVTDAVDPDRSGASRARLQWVADRSSPVSGVTSQQPLPRAGLRPPCPWRRSPLAECAPRAALPGQFRPQEESGTPCLHFRERLGVVTSLVPRRPAEASSAALCGGTFLCKGMFFGVFDSYKFPFFRCGGLRTSGTRVPGGQPGRSRAGQREDEAHGVRGAAGRPAGPRRGLLSPHRDGSHTRSLFKPLRLRSTQWGQKNVQLPKRLPRYQFSVCSVSLET